MILGVLYFLGIAFLLLLPFIAAAAVQVVLSLKRRKWWLGLLLPAFCILAGAVLGIQQACLPVAGSRPLAVLWLFLSAAVILLLVWGFCRTKRGWLRAVCAALAIGFMPLVLQQNDGGTVEYRALLYRAAFYHRILPEEQGRAIVTYDTHIEIAFFPFNWMTQDEGL